MFGATFKLVTRVGLYHKQRKMVFQLIVKNSLCHRNVFQNGVKLSHKWLTTFCQKAQSFVYFLPNDFVQISAACGQNTYQILYGETLDFRFKHKMPDRKINF